MKLPAKKQEFLHSYYVLILTFISITFLLMPLSFLLKLVMWAGVFCLYFKQGLSKKQFSTLFVISFVFALLFIVLNLIYPAERFLKGETVVIFNVVFYKNVLNNAFLNFLRILLLSHVSMASGLVINYTKVILYLSQSKKIKVNISYPLLIAINSVELFQSEYQRIKIALKFRGFSFFRQHLVIFPLLVFAIRHSQRGALSLVTRGLSKSKSYYYNYAPSLEDQKKFRLYCGCIGILFILAIMFLFL